MKALYRLALLSLVVLLALTACNGKEETPSPEPPPTTVPATDAPEPTAIPTEAPPPTEPPPAPTEPPAIEAPIVGQVGEGEGRRDDIPLMPDATNITSVGTEVTYDSASPLKAVAEFYETEMPKHGWTADPLLTFVTDFAGTLSFKKGGETATIVLAPSGTGGTRVTIGVQ